MAADDSVTPVATAPERRLRYSIVLPPGWAKVALDESADMRAHELAVLAARTAQPNVREQVRGYFERQMREAFREARDAGTQDLYLPTEAIDGIPLGMSIAITAAPLPEGAGGSVSEALLSFAEGDASAAAATVGPVLAIRRVDDVPPQLDATGELVMPATRRISYMTPPPNDDRLMLVTASILKLDIADGETLSESLEFLFDAMVRTIRFDGEGARR